MPGVSKVAGAPELNMARIAFGNKCELCERPQVFTLRRRRVYVNGYYRYTRELISLLEFHHIDSLISGIHAHRTSLAAFDCKSFPHCFSYTVTTDPPEPMMLLCSKCHHKIHKSSQFVQTYLSTTTYYTYILYFVHFDPDCPSCSYYALSTTMHATDHTTVQHYILPGLLECRANGLDTRP